MGSGEVWPTWARNCLRNIVFIVFLILRDICVGESLRRLTAGKRAEILYRWTFASVRDAEAILRRKYPEE
jgi:hypothetical protein